MKAGRSENGEVYVADPGGIDEIRELLAGGYLGGWAGFAGSRCDE